jgi:hypothetical protein
MAVTRMACPGCGISVEADFPAPRLSALPTEHQRFIEIFVLAGGNLKQIAEHAGVSYPTVRSRLDKVIESLRHEIARTQEVRGTILDAIGGEAASAEAARADEAARIIKAV